MIPKESSKSMITQYSNTGSSYKSSMRQSEEYIHTYLTIPPDGGWGWLVVLGTFLCNFVADGTLYTIGLFLDDISKTYHTTPTRIGLMSSIMTGFYYFLGPVTCSLVNHLGFQITAVLGGLMAAAGFCFSTFFTSFIPFVIVVGVFGGFGFSLLYVASIIATGFYFEKWRALASSLAMTGSAAGMIGFPILMHSLSNYNWQFRFYVISALCFLAGLLGILFRPVKPTRVLTNKDHVVLQVFTSAEELDSISSADGKKKSGFLGKIYNRFHNTKYPTQAKLYKDSTLLMFFPAGSSESSVFVNSVSEDASMGFINPATSKTFDNRSERFDKLSVVHENDIVKSKKKCPCRCCRWCPRCHVNRPLYRDDIFYGGSLYTLADRSQIKPSQLSKGKSADYTLSVTRVHFRNKQRIHLKCCPESVLRTLVTMLHFQLMEDIPFSLFVVSGFFTVLGMYVPFVYLVERSNEFRIDKNMSPYFYTTVGISNAIGRVLSGVISSIPRADTTLIVTVSLILCGLATIVSCFLEDVYSQFAFYAIFGLTLSSFATLRTAIVVDLLGLENLTNAFGLMLLFSGLSAYLGIPIAAKIISLTDSYNNGFLFSGSALLFSGLLMVPIKTISGKKGRT